MKNYLVFTDLDGTLLNHDDYSFHEALESIHELQKRSIPIIIITSKTFAEVVDLQKEIGIQHPFIVENGAGTFIPKECPLASTVIYKEKWTKVSSAHSYIELRLFFTNLKRSYPVTHMYNEYHGIQHTTVALGDSANDFEMIKAADIGVLIQGHDLQYAHIGDENIKRSDFPGPKGWHKCISEILSC